MDELTEGKITLRKASADEIEFLKARAAKQDKMNLKKYGTCAAISFLAVGLIFILNETRFHKPFNRILAICIFVIEIIAWSIFLYVCRKGLSKQIVKGEFKIQRGTIIELIAPDQSTGSNYWRGVFESEDGITSVIKIENDYFKELAKGPCLLIKWDSYGDQEVYEVAMLNQEL